MLTFSVLCYKILGLNGELNTFHTPAYRKLFDEIVPETMGRLLHDQSPKAIADASVTYNMFAEGVTKLRWVIGRFMKIWLKD